MSTFEGFREPRLDSRGSNNNNGWWWEEWILPGIGRKESPKDFRSFFNDCAYRFFEEEMTKGDFFEVCCLGWTLKYLDRYPDASPRSLWSLLKQAYMNGINQQQQSFTDEGENGSSGIVQWILPSPEAMNLSRMELDVDESFFDAGNGEDPSLDYRKCIAYIMEFWKALYEAATPGDSFSASRKFDQSIGDVDGSPTTRATKRRRTGFSRFQSSGAGDRLQGTYKLPALYLVVSVLKERAESWDVLRTLAHELPTLAFKTFSERDIHAGLALVGLQAVSMAKNYCTKENDGQRATFDGLSASDLITDYFSNTDVFGLSILPILEDATKLHVYIIKAVICRQVMNPIIESGAAAKGWTREMNNILSACVDCMTKEHPLRYVTNLTRQQEEQRTDKRRWQKSPSPLIPSHVISPAYPLLTQIYLWLLQDDIVSASQLARAMDSSPCLDDSERGDSKVGDVKDRAWLSIWQYLLGEGKLFLDGNDQESKDYIHKRDFLYNCMMSGSSVWARLVMMDFFEEVASKFWGQQNANVEEKKYVLLACQQTVLRLLFKACGLGRNTILNFIKESQWPIDEMPPTNADQDLDAWAFGFLEMKNPIPASLIDPDTGRVNLTDRFEPIDRYQVEQQAPSTLEIGTVTVQVEAPSLSACENEAEDLEVTENEYFAIPPQLTLQPVGDIAMEKSYPHDVSKSNRQESKTTADSDFETEEIVNSERDEGYQISETNFGEVGGNGRDYLGNEEEKEDEEEEEDDYDEQEEEEDDDTVVLVLDDVEEAEVENVVDSGIHQEYSDQDVNDAEEAHHAETSEGGSEDPNDFQPGDRYELDGTDDEDPTDEDATDEEEPEIIEDQEAGDEELPLEIEEDEEDRDDSVVEILDDDDDDDNDDDDGMDGEEDEDDHNAGDNQLEGEDYLQDEEELEMDYVDEAQQVEAMADELQTRDIVVGSDDVESDEDVDYSYENEDEQDDASAEADGAAEIRSKPVGEPQSEDSAHGEAAENVEESNNLVVDGKISGSLNQTWQENSHSPLPQEASEILEDTSTAPQSLSKLGEKSLSREAQSTPLKSAMDGEPIEEGIESGLHQSGEPEVRSSMPRELDNEANPESDPTDDEHEVVQRLENVESATAIGGEFGDTTEEEDYDDENARFDANSSAQADRLADAMTSKVGYTSQLEDGYEPEDTHGYTEEEVSEAIHTEDEEDEHLQGPQELENSALIADGLVYQASVDQNVENVRHSSDDMDMADEQTEPEEDLGAESSELEDPTESEPMIGTTSVKASSQPSSTLMRDPMSLLEFAQSAQQKHDWTAQAKDLGKRDFVIDTASQRKEMTPDVMEIEESGEIPYSQDVDSNAPYSFDADDENDATEGSRSLETEEETMGQDRFDEDEAPFRTTPSQESETMAPDEDTVEHEKLSTVTAVGKLDVADPAPLDEDDNVIEVDSNIQVNGSRDGTEQEVKIEESAMSPELGLSASDAVSRFENSGGNISEGSGGNVPVEESTDRKESTSYGYEKSDVEAAVGESQAEDPLDVDVLPTEAIASAAKFVIADTRGTSQTQDTASNDGETQAKSIMPPDEPIMKNNVQSESADSLDVVESYQDVLINNKAKDATIPEEATEDYMEYDHGGEQKVETWDAVGMLDDAMDVHGASISFRWAEGENESAPENPSHETLENRVSKVEEEATGARIENVIDHAEFEQNKGDIEADKVVEDHAEFDQNKGDVEADTEIEDHAEFDQNKHDVEADKEVEDHAEFDQNTGDVEADKEIKDDEGDSNKVDAIELEGDLGDANDDDEDRNENSKRGESIGSQRSGRHLPKKPASDISEVDVNPVQSEDVEVVDSKEVEGEDNVRHSDDESMEEKVPSPRKSSRLRPAKSGEESVPRSSSRASRSAAAKIVLTAEVKTSTSPTTRSRTKAKEQDVKTGGRPPKMPKRKKADVSAATADPPTKRSRRSRNDDTKGSPHDSFFETPEKKKESATPPSRRTATANRDDDTVQSFQSRQSGRSTRKATGDVERRGATRSAKPPRKTAAANSDDDTVKSIQSRQSGRNTRQKSGVVEPASAARSSNSARTPIKAKSDDDTVKSVQSRQSGRNTRQKSGDVEPASAARSSNSARTPAKAKSDDDTVKSVQSRQSGRNTRRTTRDVEAVNAAGSPKSTRTTRSRARTEKPTTGGSETPRRSIRGQTRIASGKQVAEESEKSNDTPRKSTVGGKKKNGGKSSSVAPAEPITEEPATRKSTRIKGKKT